ncbi:MAG: winged helix-turn-helix transcriptional regulator [archaeon GB-1867-005]|nr:winged helix-turn-helix transcriptional regulator [Candidatus Culexmicrobium cathedralense]
MDIFKLLALKGASKILIALYENDLLIYSQLVEIVGYSTTTNRAIKKLIEFRLIKRRVLDERYRPVAYSLTETGRKLSEIIMQLMDFEKRLKASAQKSY